MRRSPRPPETSPCSSTARRSEAAGSTTPSRSASAGTAASTSARTTALWWTAATPARRRSHSPEPSGRWCSTLRRTWTANTSTTSTSTTHRATPSAASRHRTAATMSDNDHTDVLIAAYLFEDLAKRDFDAVLKLAEDRTIKVEGVVVVRKDADGEVSVIETGDHLGRKGAKVGGGAGFVVGLFAPPLLAAPAVGAAAGGVMGKFAKHRLESGIGEKMDAALPPSSGGVIAVYDSRGAATVDKALANAVRKSVAHVDGASAKELKAGLAEAQAGIAGG